MFEACLSLAVKSEGVKLRHAQQGAGTGVGALTGPRGLFLQGAACVAHTPPRARFLGSNPCCQHALLAVFNPQQHTAP